MKRFLLTPLMVILVSGLILAGCAAPGEPEVIKLVFTDHNVETSYGTIHGTEIFLDRIEAATNGRVEIERYYGETLAKGTDAWEVAKSGTADISWCVMGYWPGLAPLTEVMQLPFIPFENAERASGIYWKLYDKFPEMQQEYADVHPLLLFSAAPYRLLTTEKQVKTLDDLKGLKIRALGGPQTEALDALGATPMLVPFPEVYMDMKTGVLDGVATPFGGCEIFNFHEVGKYMTNVTITVAPFTIVMNLEKWNSLPPDIQEAINSVCDYEASRWYGKYYSDGLDEAGVKEIKEYAGETGHELVEYTIPPEELARWQEVGARPLWDAWTAKMEAQGLPGKAVLEEVLRLAETEPK